MSVLEPGHSGLGVHVSTVPQWQKVSKAEPWQWRQGPDGPGQAWSVVTSQESGLWERDYVGDRVGPPWS